MDGWGYPLARAHRSQCDCIRDFYRDVIGWICVPEDMGGYSDFHMLSSRGGNSVAGICYARGVIADLPPVWLIYIVVKDVDVNAQMYEDLGGELVVQPWFMGDG